ncbi:MAG: endonuclease [Marmoricola sp.]|nr:endonuclease [Marmoricola sp.]
MTSTTALASSRVLAAARRFRAEADAAEVGVFVEALAWARLHVVTDPEDSATWGDSPVPLAGDGAPMVSEFCVSELAAALGMSRESGRFLLAHALEIAYRLPKVWVRVQTGELPVWRARRIAEKTLHLSLEAAGFVDDQIAGFAHRIGPAATERLVDEAVARFMPEEAAKIAAAAADGRFVTIDHTQQSFAATSLIRGELDRADALDLDQALIRGAETLKAAGSEDSLDARRSMALGALARGEDGLSLQTARSVTLFVHLAPDAHQSGLATVENKGPNLVTLEQVKTWCAEANVTLRPVIDLNTSITSTGYQPSKTIREQVIVRDKTCVFAYCNRSARSADLDHIEPYDPDKPPDQTTTSNLASLCRPHHRLKTFGGWNYTQIEPGTYLWRSPHGYQYLRDSDGGTQDVTPRPVDPPGS